MSVNNDDDLAERADEAEARRERAAEQNYGILPDVCQVCDSAFEHCTHRPLLGEDL